MDDNSGSVVYYYILVVCFIDGSSGSGCIIF